MAEKDSGADRIYQPAAVECYSGYKACDRPVAFTCQGRRRERSEILDRWYRNLGLITFCPLPVSSIQYREGFHDKSAGQRPCKDIGHNMQKNEPGDFPDTGQRTVGTGALVKNP